MDLEPIIIPAGWDATQDLASFNEEGWLPVPSYRAALSEWLNFHHSGFLCAVMLSVSRFLARNPGLLPFEPDCLSTAEQIERLLHWVRGLPTLASTAQRSSPACTEAERARLLAAHLQAGEGAWLYPLVRLAHRLGNCGIDLEEAMGWEDLGYDEVKRQWQAEL